MRRSAVHLGRTVAAGIAQIALCLLIEFLFAGGLLRPQHRVFVRRGHAPAVVVERDATKTRKLQQNIELKRGGDANLALCATELCRLQLIDGLALCAA